jgi:hypothetical protein
MLPITLKPTLMATVKDNRALKSETTTSRVLLVGNLLVVLMMVITGGNFLVRNKPFPTNISHTRHHSAVGIDFLKG